MPNITFGGLASGLDTNQIIQQLLLLESRQLDRYQQQRDDLVSRQSQQSTFKSKLQSLSDTITDLEKTSELSLFTTTSSDDGVVTLTASGAASTGNHTIDVTQLAEAESGATAAFADKDTTTYGTGQLQITVGGNTVNVDITAGQNDTLEGIRDAINAADAGVQASIINDGSGYRIVVQSESTGVSNAFSLTSSGFSTDPFSAFSQINAAQDAQFTIDGLAVTSATNDATDVLEGVTIQLHDVGSNVNTTVSRDVDAIEARLQEFVDAYNDVLDFIDSQETLDDSSLTTIKRQLTNAFQTNLDSGTFNLVALAQVGVETDGAGRATIDRTNLENAISQDFGAFQEVFAGTSSGDDGIAKVFDNVLNGFTNTSGQDIPGILSSGTGLLAARKESLDARIRSLDDRIENESRRIDRVEEQLVARFASFEALTSQYQSQGAFLQQAFIGLR